MLTHLAVIIVRVGKDSGSVLTEKYAEVRVHSCYSSTLFFPLDDAMAANEARGEREFCIFLSNNANLTNNSTAREI